MMHARRSKTVASASALGAALLAACLTSFAAAQDSAAPTEYVIRAKAVYPVIAESPGPIAEATIWVRDGKIVAVGASVDAPPGLPVVDYRDYVIVPGFVDAGAGLAGAHDGPESVSGAYSALDSFDTYGDYRELLARGTTTAHLDPGGHRLVTGVGAVVKLAGAPGERVLSAASDLCVNLGVFNPPDLPRRPFYGSSDVAIEAAIRQRPESRLGMLLELEQRLAGPKSALDFDAHGAAFFARWSAGATLRVQARRAADIEAALAFVKKHKRTAYLVGAAQSDQLSDEVLGSGLPVVVRFENTYDRPTYAVGDDPEALDVPLHVAARLAHAATTATHRGPALKLALTAREYDTADLRMIALLARSGGLDEATALAAITRMPAEIIGVADRVGSLAPGMDADFVVLNRPPLESGASILRTFVNGRPVYRAASSGALVVRAGRIWTGDGDVIHDGSLLIEDGKIKAVGQRVPQPPEARVIDAGPDAYVTPGFIDAHGHLGLERDESRISSDVPIHQVVGVSDLAFERVAAGGVTTVLLSAYRAADGGSRVAAIKTYGNGRDSMVTRADAGVQFSVVGEDPLLVDKSIRATLEKAKKYAESWTKYYDELKKWNEAQAAGKKIEIKPVEQQVVTESKADPITGTWEYAISGGPIPEPVSGEMRLRLTGTQIEGRISDPEGSGEDARLVGSLDGDQVRLELDEETPFGAPVISAKLTEDHLKGEVIIGDVLTLNFAADRTDKSPVEFTVKRSKRRGKDGRPEPPVVNPLYEPFRPLLAGKTPAVVEARTAAEIRAALRLFVDDYKIPVVLVGAEDAALVIDEIVARKEQVGVVLPPQLERRRDRRPYFQAIDLQNQGVRLALQSDGEDEARNLPQMALYAVQRGLGGDAALRALTIDAAKLFKIDDRVGVLAPGRDADVLIHSGYPFDAGSRLERVIVAGQEVPREN